MNANASSTSPYKPSLFSVLKEAVRGKAVSRTMTNLFWLGVEPISGNILDIGGGSRGSHYRFLQIKKEAAIKVADIFSRPVTDFVLNIAKERLPPQGASQNAVFYSIFLTSSTRTIQSSPN